jgi:flagellar hook-length control protein FliK
MSAILALMQILSPQASQGQGQGALQPNTSSMFSASMLGEDPALFRAKLEEAAARLSQSPADAKGGPVLPGWLSALQQAWGIDAPMEAAPMASATHKTTLSGGGASLATAGLSGGAVMDVAQWADGEQPGVEIVPDDGGRFEQINIAGIFAFLTGKLEAMQAQQEGSADADRDGVVDATGAAMAMPVWWQMEPSRQADIRSAFASLIGAVEAGDAVAADQAFSALGAAMPPSPTAGAVAQLPPAAQLQAFAAWLPPVRQPLDAAKSSTMISSEVGAELVAQSPDASLPDAEAGMGVLVAANVVDVSGAGPHVPQIKAVTQSVVSSSMAIGGEEPTLPVGGDQAGQPATQGKYALLPGLQQAAAAPMQDYGMAPDMNFDSQMEAVSHAADGSGGGDTAQGQPADGVHGSATISNHTVQQASKAESLLRTAPIPIADQVHVQIRQAMREGNDQVTIQLDPLELGRIEVVMDFAQDGTHIHIRAEKPETLDLLQKDARELARNLQQSGIRADMSQLSFSLRQDQGGFAQGDQEQSKGGFSQNWRQGDDEAAPADITTALARARWNTKALDIEV